MCVMLYTVLQNIMSVFLGLDFETGEAMSRMKTILVAVSWIIPSYSAHAI